MASQHGTACERVCVASVLMRARALLCHIVSVGLFDPMQVDATIRAHRFPSGFATEFAPFPYTYPASATPPERDMMAGQKHMASSRSNSSMGSSCEGVLHALAIPTPQREKIEAAIKDASAKSLPAWGSLSGSSAAPKPSTSASSSTKPAPGVAGVAVTRDLPAQGGNRMGAADNEVEAMGEGVGEETDRGNANEEANNSIFESISAALSPGLSPEFGPQDSVLPESLSPMRGPPQDQAIPELQAPTQQEPQAPVRVAGPTDPGAMSVIAKQHVAMSQARGLHNVVAAVSNALTEAVEACNCVFHTASADNPPLLRLVLSLPQEVSQREDLTQMFRDLMPLFPTGSARSLIV